MSRATPGDPDTPARITRAKVSTLYSGAAEDYEELWAPELLPLSRALLPHLQLENARHVLEAAAGVGSLLSDLRIQAPEATIIAADLSLGMIKRAPSDFPRAVSDASALAFRDDSFDVGILAFVLFHLFDPAKGIAEMARVLRPGGLVGTVTWGVENDPPAFQVWAEELDRHGASPQDRDLTRHEEVDTPEKVEALMAAHGIRPVRSWLGEYRKPATPDEFIAHRTRHGQGRLRLLGMPADIRIRCLEKARRRLEHLTPGDFEEIAEVVYVVGQNT